MPMEQSFTLGVNYWPRRKAMYWWSQFDPGEVRDEFALIASLGLQVVRIFLLWDDFLPTPEVVNPAALQNLETVCDIAVETGLKLEPTFFTGHMSGPNWAPRWLLGGPRPGRRQGRPRPVVSQGRASRKGYRNSFHDPVAVTAARLLLQSVVRTLKDHPAIWLWNLGNEPDLFDWPNTPADGRAWVHDMVELIHSMDAHHPVTCGLHAGSLVEHNNLRVDQVFRETDLAVMHAYPMYLPVARQPLDPDFVPFTCALTAALSGKPVLMEEFGGCTASPGKPSHTMTWQVNGQPRSQFMASEEDLADYLQKCLHNLVDVGALGALIWCFADYSRDLWTRPPCNQFHHERFFGLVRPDGSLKPHARVLKDFAASHPIVQPIPGYARLSVDPDKFYDLGSMPLAHLPGLYQEYLSRKRV